ncbi:MAG: hypothetical protein M1814_001915 [Vezdaea aestivalis]|nr:MAG: hypothetical protein M1814_001915 [Vezdaea aestivalis]
MYHTPQSNSPASVASPTAPEHRASIYGQPPQQIAPSIYGYGYQPMPPQHQQPHPSYPHQSAPQYPSLTSQPMLVAHPSQMQHSNASNSAISNSPRSKLTQPPLQRPHSGGMGGGVQNPVTGPPIMNSNMAHSMAGPGNGGPAVNPNAAPGPIPATTPLVVRQDNNGVQWIAFEYSRDRVKMEYTIRCDVESVAVDSLPQDFKTENCVYPRACCQKEQYRGNRLVYETECNTVGWALADLNPCLRGKRGLIQRAVDSWRNSNQDPRLRSRRVRRMAKMNNRKAVQSHGQHTNAMAAPPSISNIPPPTGMPSSTGMVPASMKSSMSMPTPIHHHHNHSDGSNTGSADDVNAQSNYSESSHHHHQPPNGSTNSTPDLRQTHIFQGYPNYPSAGNVGAAMPPSIHDPMGALSGHSGPSATAIATSTSRSNDEDAQNSALFGNLPEAKRRKFILVDDPHRGSRVRVRVMLDQVNMKEIPDSYRKTNSVYPRSYFPVQMQSPPDSLDGKNSFDDDDDDDETALGDRPGRGKTVVPMPMLDGSEGDIALPTMGRKRRAKEIFLNDLGYRMSWSQSRVFAGRTMFLQRSLDAYRNKMRSTMITSGADVTTTAPNFETRAGKRRFLERTRAKRAASP